MMTNNRVHLRLSDAELAFLRDEASSHGLPVATLCKMKVFAALDRDRLAEAIAREEERKDFEYGVWKREIASVAVVKWTLMHIAKALDVDVEELEGEADRIVDEIFDGRVR